MCADSTKHYSGKASVAVKQISPKHEQAFFPDPVIFSCHGLVNYCIAAGAFHVVVQFEFSKATLVMKTLKEMSAFTRSGASSVSRIRFRAWSNVCLKGNYSLLSLGQPRPGVPHISSPFLWLSLADSQSPLRFHGINEECGANEFLSRPQSNPILNQSNSIHIMLLRRDRLPLKMRIRYGGQRVWDI